MAGGALHVLRDVSLTVVKGRIVGLVGESGSGKSTLALALLGCCRAIRAASPAPIEFDGLNLLALPAEALDSLRGQRIAMIFQDPMTALNPVFTIGTQLVDAQRGKYPELGRQALAATRRRRCWHASASLTRRRGSPPIRISFQAACGSA